MGRYKKMKFSVGFHLFYLDHVQHESYCSLYFLLLPHVCHSFSRGSPRLRCALAWRQKASPAQPEEASPQLGKVNSKSRWPGTLRRTMAARRFGYAKWINYMAKPSASWFSSSHETKESLKICHYCNKAKKLRHSVFLLFRILWKFQP